MSISNSFSQYLFVEERDWTNKEEYVYPLDIDLKLVITPDTFNKKDTVKIEYFYQNNKIAIEGNGIVGYEKKINKIGAWNFYYKNGNIWTIRSYNKHGSLSSIDSLVTKDGTSLNHGYGRALGKSSSMHGHINIYNSNGELEWIGLYKAGSLKKIFEKDRYSEKQLKRIIIREFKISENEVLEELSYEEAVELQKTDPKPIFLNASASWNGYTNRAYRDVFTDPEVAKYIKDNFHLAYLDIYDTQDIIIKLNGEDIFYKGAPYKNRQSYHEAAKKIIGQRLRATPVLVFLKNGNEVLYHYVGIEKKKEDFMKVLHFFVDGHYKEMTWKEYSK
jgi:thioredoxin-related protein